VAASIRVIELQGLPEKGDVSDWLDQGHSVAELDALAAEPEAPAEDGAQLLEDVRAFLARFISYPSTEACTTHVLWIIHAHLMDAWESTPRIAFLSAEPASGKTRALEISELLVPRPVEAVNVSPAYLFRKVGSEDGGPTILYDEIDTVFGPKAKENEEIRGLLNAGHRRGVAAGRCVVRGKVVETEEIPAYCAVALAGLGWLPDTLLSRSVIIRMARRAPSERIEPYRRRVHAAEGLALHNRIADWASKTLGTVTGAWPEMPAGVEDRDADVWEPLLAIADAAGGSWPDRARVAAVALVAASRDAMPSLGIRLLADLRTIFGDRDLMSTKDIITALCGIEEAPWSDLKGKPINPRGLAMRLRQYGVTSKVVRVGYQTPHGYLRADLHDPWHRYLGPSADESATSATSATGGQESSESATSGVANGNPDVADVADSPSDVADCDPPEASESANVAGVADVAFPRGDEEREVFEI
jgi:hypothetical protein